MREVNCNLCGSNQYVIEYRNSDDGKEGGYRISEAALTLPREVVRCRKCGLVYVSRREDSEEILKQYSDMVDEKYVEEEQGRRLTARRVLSKLEGFRHGNRLLEVGCGTGFFLDEAQKRGWEVTGVELSCWAVNFCRDKFGIDVKNMSLEEARFPSSSFDAVVLEDMIEHFMNPRQSLEEIRRILKPDGIVYINTPDIESLASRILKARWWGINRYHLYYFSRRTLSRLLDATGLKVS